MAKFSKIPLLSFIACALTIGGAFGVWYFGESGSSGQGVGNNINTSTYPMDYWQFNSVSYTFCANSRANSTEEGYVSGTFSSSGTINESMSVHQGAGLNYESYFTSIVSEKGTPTTTEEGYVFSHWGYYKEGEQTVTHFNFDVGLDESTTLYAQYVPNTNPAIYLSSDTEFANPIAYFFENPNSDGEFMANNFIAQEMASRGGHYIIRYNETSYPCKHGEKDTVYQGTYTVFFNATASDVETWVTYGGNAFFQRQYKFSLVGNPATQWSFSPSKNVILGYDSEVKDGDTKRTVTYSASKIYFTSELWGDNLTPNYEFKIMDPYFNLWPGGVGAVETFVLIDSSTTVPVGSNLTPNNLKACLYNVSAEIFLEEITTFDEYEIYDFYPKTAKITLTPCEYKINYYDQDKSELVAEENVAYGEKALKHTTETSPVGSIESDTYSTDYGRHFISAWKDIYTGEIIDFSNGITRNMSVYPLYGEKETPSATITIYTSYNSTWSDPVVYRLYNHVGYNTYSDNTLKDATYSGYKFEGWTTDLSITSSTIVSTTDLKTGTLGSDVTGDLTYYPRLTKVTASSTSGGTTNLISSGFTYNNNFTDISHGTFYFGASTIYIHKYRLGINSPTNSNTTLTTSTGIYKVSNSTVYRYIEFDYNGHSWWGDGSAVTMIHSWSSSSVYADTQMSNIATKIRYAWIPAAHTNLLFARAQSSSSSYWNQTADISISTYSSSKFVYEITSLWASGQSHNGNYKSIYFNNSSKKFANPYCYAWKASNNSNDGTWPGYSMVNIATNIYRRNIRYDCDRVIFTNNGSNQTADLTPGNYNYYTSSNSWEFYIKN